MPAAILETVEATWDRPRTPKEIRDFLGPRLASHALVDVDVEADNFDVDSFLADVE